MTGAMKLNYLTTGKIAKYCEVNVKTVLKWIEDKELESHALPSGKNRVPRESFVSFLKRFNLPVPQELEVSGSPRILIVDDEANVIQGIMRSLKTADYIIDSALNGFDAGQKLITFKPDMVLLDICMPGMDGVEVLRRLRASNETRHIKVIVISGYVDAETEEILKQIGVEGIISKPFYREELLQLMEKVATA